MKLADMLPADFLKDVELLDTEMHDFFINMEVNDENKENFENLCTSADARVNFLENLAYEIESSKTLAQALPESFMKKLQKRDQHICQILGFAPASQYSREIRNAFRQEKVQDLVLSWFDSKHEVLARYTILNLTMSDIAEAVSSKIDDHSRVTADYLKNLSKVSGDEISSEIKKFAEKYNGANLLNEQDVQGCTLAHYVADRGLTQKYDGYILDVLAENNVDFSIKNKMGNTPMHIMAINSEERASAYMFVDFIKYAAKTKFDFAALNNQGLSVLHIAAINQYADTIMGHFVLRKYENIKYILEAAKENNLSINLNVLSRSGSTALFYLINHARYDEANLLLDAGADHQLYGDNAADRSPMKQVKEHLHLLKEMKSDEEGSKLKQINEQIKILEALKSRFLSLTCSATSDFFKVDRICGPITLNSINDKTKDTAFNNAGESDRFGPGYGF